MHRLDSSEQRKQSTFAPAFKERFRTESARFRKEVVHSQVKVLEKATHMITITRPKEVEKMMRDFLE